MTSSYVDVNLVNLNCSVGLRVSYATMPLEQLYRRRLDAIGCAIALTAHCANGLVVAVVQRFVRLTIVRKVLELLGDRCSAALKTFDSSTLQLLRLSGFTHDDVRV